MKNINFRKPEMKREGGREEKLICCVEKEN